MVVLEEFGQTGVGKGMLEQALDGRKRTGRYICACLEAVDDMAGMTYGWLQRTMVPKP